VGRDRKLGSKERERRPLASGKGVRALELGADEDAFDSLCGGVVDLPYGRMARSVRDQCRTEFPRLVGQRAGVVYHLHAIADLGPNGPGKSCHRKIATHFSHQGEAHRLTGRQRSVLVP